MDERNPIARLNDWANTVEDWNETLKQISGSIDETLRQYQAITEENQIGDALVELLFMCNRLEHMVRVWHGESDDD